MFKKYWLLTLACVLMIGIMGVSAQALTFTTGVTSIGSTGALFWFKPSDGTCNSVVLHYQVSGASQQNVNIGYNISTSQWEYPVGCLIPGQTVTYNFTYDSDGQQLDTQSTTWNVPVLYTNLVWSDEFDGNSLDRTKWNYQIGNGYNTGNNQFDGWGTGEWGWAREQNVSVSNGELIIRGDYNSTPQTIEGRNWYQYTGRITTKGLQAWQYGKVEARIKLPTAIASWPAFWMMGNVCNMSINGARNGYDMLPTNWASCGEIDILEHRNDENRISNGLCWDTRTSVNPWNGNCVAYNSTWANEVDVSQYHVYGMEWDGNAIIWYLDGVPTMVQDTSVANMEEFRQPFFILLSLAVAGQFPGTIPVISQFPIYMNVDYVRVYQ